MRFQAWIARVLLAMFCSGTTAAWAFDHSHAVWDGLLKRHVVVLDAGKASRVRYAGMAQERAALKSYLAALSAVPESEFEGWTAAADGVPHQCLQRQALRQPLDDQLDEQTARFLSDRSRNRYRDGRLEVSRIFEWFKEDFEPRGRYFARHAALLSSDPEHRRLIAQGTAPLVFLDYDWSLNDVNADLAAGPAPGGTGRGAWADDDINPMI